MHKGLVTLLLTRPLQRIRSHVCCFAYCYRAVKCECLKIQGEVRLSVSFSLVYLLKSAASPVSKSCFICSASCRSTCALFTDQISVNSEKEHPMTIIAQEQTLTVSPTPLMMLSGTMASTGGRLKPTVISTWPLRLFLPSRCGYIKPRTVRARCDGMELLSRPFSL